MNLSATRSTTHRRFVLTGGGAAFALVALLLTGCGKEDPAMTAAPSTKGNAPPPVANRDVSHRLPPLAGAGARAGKGGE